MTALPSEFVIGFVDLLRWVRTGYENTNDPAVKREWFRRQLRILGRMAREIDPSVDDENLLTPLNELIFSLYCLDYGTADPPLQPVKQTYRSQAPRWAQFRGWAAAASELLIRNGATAPEADASVAKRLNSEGYQKPAYRGDTRITAATINGWRKAAREGRPGELMRAAFHTWLDNNGPREELLRLVAPAYPALLFLDRIEPPANVDLAGMLPSVSVLEMLFAHFPPSASSEE
jgi:hypothetical protein